VLLSQSAEDISDFFKNQYYRDEDEDDLLINEGKIAIIVTGLLLVDLDSCIRLSVVVPSVVAGEAVAPVVCKHEKMSI
jgi:hypothetical protein